MEKRYKIALFHSFHDTRSNLSITNIGIFLQGCQGWPPNELSWEMFISPHSPKFTPKIKWISFRYFHLVISSSKQVLYYGVLRESTYQNSYTHKIYFEANNYTFVLVWRNEEAENIVCNRVTQIKMPFSFY